MIGLKPAGSWVNIIAPLLLAAMAGSCAHDEISESDFAPSEVDETVNVSLKEWYVLPDKNAVNTGNITFKVSNHGRMDHEFIVTKTATPFDALPVTEEGLNEKKAGTELGEIEDIPPGETRMITLHLTPGRYILYCNKMGMEDHQMFSHYRRGMRVAFTVR